MLGLVSLGVSGVQASPCRRAARAHNAAGSLNEEFSPEALRMEEGFEDGDQGGREAGSKI